MLRRDCSTCVAYVFKPALRLEYNTNLKGGNWFKSPFYSISFHTEHIPSLRIARHQWLAIRFFTGEPWSPSTIPSLIPVAFT